VHRDGVNIADLREPKLAQNRERHVNTSGPDRTATRNINNLRRQSPKMFHVEQKAKYGAGR
jgi:hypothetical protein